jgi:hypothetical protein
MKAKTKKIVQSEQRTKFFRLKIWVPQKSNKDDILKSLWINEEGRINILKWSDSVWIEEKHVILKLENGEIFKIPCPECMDKAFKVRDILCQTEDSKKIYKITWAFCVKCWYFQIEPLNWWKMLNTDTKLRKKKIILSERLDYYVTNFFSFFKTKNFIIMFLTFAVLFLLAINKDIRQITADILWNSISISRDGKK